MPSTPQKPFKAHHPLPFFCIDNVLYLLNKTIFSPISLILIPSTIYYLQHGSSFPTFNELKHLFWSNSSPFKTLNSIFIISLTKNLNSLLNRNARNHGAFKRDPTNWKNDTIVITGGSTGIGKCLVENLSQVHHAKIVVLDMAPPSYRPAPKGAPEILYYKTDVSNEEQVKDVAGKVKKVFGDTVGVLVNCAGIARGGSIVDTSPEAALGLWKVNTLAHFITCRQFLPNIIARNHGHVVSVASGASYACLPSMSQYAVSKAGALAFHEVLSGEFRARYSAPRVRNTIVCPLKVTTQLGAGMDEAPNQFLAPTLEPETVAENIAAALNSGLSQHIMMPAIANLLPWLRVWPDWMKRGFEIMVPSLIDPITRATKNGYGRD